MMKSSQKEEAEDVNEPVKSPMTAVTTVAPAIKHGALTAPEIHLGLVGSACLSHVPTQAVHTRTIVSTHTVSVSITEG